MMQFVTRGTNKEIHNSALYQGFWSKVVLIIKNTNVKKKLSKNLYIWVWRKIYKDKTLIFFGSIIYGDWY